MLLLRSKTNLKHKALNEQIFPQTFGLNYNCMF